MGLDHDFKEIIEDVKDLPTDISDLSINLKSTIQVGNQAVNYLGSIPADAQTMLSDLKKIESDIVGAAGKLGGLVGTGKFTAVFSASRVENLVSKAVDDLDSDVKDIKHFLSSGDISSVYDWFTNDVLNDDATAAAAMTTLITDLQSCITTLQTQSSIPVPAYIDQEVTSVLSVIKALPSVVTGTLYKLLPNDDLTALVATINNLSQSIQSSSNSVTLVSATAGGESSLQVHASEALVLIGATTEILMFTLERIANAFPLTIKVSDMVGAGIVGDAAVGLAAVAYGAASTGVTVSNYTGAGVAAVSPTVFAVGCINMMLKTIKVGCDTIAIEVFIEEDA